MSRSGMAHTGNFSINFASASSCEACNSDVVSLAVVVPMSLLSLHSPESSQDTAGAAVLAPSSRPHSEKQLMREEEAVSIFDVARSSCERV